MRMFIGEIARYILPKDITPIASQINGLLLLKRTFLHEVRKKTENFCEEGRKEISPVV